MMNSSRLIKYIPWFIFAVIICGLPYVINSPYFTSIMIFVALYGVLAIGMGVLMGFAGLFSLVGPTWFGLGAYIAGILSARGLLPPSLSILVAAASTALIAYLIGAPVLRLKGLYLACATFGILIITQIAFVQLGDLTGGHSGLLGIPALKLFGFKLVNDRHYYFLSWVLCFGCMLFLSNIMKSRVGRAIISSHDSETASASLGVNIPKYRLQLFVLTAVMGSLAGSVLCFYLRFVEPGIFGFDLLVEITLMAIIGGMNSVWGPLLGSLLITWLHEILKTFLGKVFPIMTGEVTAIFFGCFIIAVLIFMPRGLIGWVEQLIRLGKRKHEHIAASKNDG